MIRCYLGAALLAVLLFLGIVSTEILTQRREEVLCQAIKALEAAEADQWDRAQDQADRARELWERGRRLSSVLSDHSALEKIDEAFAALHFSRDPGDYYELCRALEAISREHRASPENIF